MINPWSAWITRDDQENRVWLKNLGPGLKVVLITTFTTQFERAGQRWCASVSQRHLFFAFCDSDPSASNFIMPKYSTVSIQYSIVNFLKPSILEKFNGKIPHFLYWKKPLCAIVHCDVPVWVRNFKIPIVKQQNYNFLSVGNKYVLHHAKVFHLVASMNQCHWGCFCAAHRASTQSVELRGLHWSSANTKPYLEGRPGRGLERESSLDGHTMLSIHYALSAHYAHYANAYCAYQ